MVDFPLPLCDLPALEIVELSHNQIADITAEIRKLSSLNILNLSNNQFEEFPYTVSEQQGI